MKKKFKIFFKRTLLTLFIVIAALTAFILFPQLLFANKMEYKKFKVCSNDKITNDIKIVLDDAMHLVKKSALYDSSYKYNIILCHNSFYNKIDDLLGFGPAARSRLHNVIIKVRIDPKSNLAFATFPKQCEVDLTYLFAHEMIHCLQAKKYGIMKFNPFRHPEFWKLEGYPEYISRRPQLLSKNYSLVDEIERYTDLKNKATGIWILTEEGGCEMPDYYYKGRLMMEYLMDIKHLAYDQILQDTVSENTIFKEMIKWKDSTKKFSKT
ncbi:MAG TPA: hypothetical protein VNM35_08080 [Chitinophagaceae bacterium]|nr:hypothetical protein [Chitinophagaceae bacterium]